MWLVLRSADLKPEDIRWKGLEACGWIEVAARQRARVMHRIDTVRNQAFPTGHGAQARRTLTRILTKSGEALLYQAAHFDID